LLAAAVNSGMGGPDLNLPLVTVTNARGCFCPWEVMYFIFSALGVHMSSLNDRVAASTEARLSSVAGAVVKLKAQLSELTELRERVKKAQGPNVEAERPSKTNTPS
jgi:hypothetical protein